MGGKRGIMMHDRIVLVTGASRGIGAATAKLLAGHGAALAVNFHSNQTAAEDVVAAIEGDGGRAVAVQADVREQAEVESMVNRVSEELGPIDTLVANASIQFPVVPFIEYQWEDFQAKLVGELSAAFFCCRAVVPSMIEHQRGCIIAVSSGLSRHPGEGFCAHSTAKSGLDAFVRSLALELGPHGIRVNTVSPGLTITDATAFLPQEAKDAAARATPLGRNAEPEDIAGVVLAMATDATGFVTGAYVPVSGGSLML
jgi:3-oxoacyl-[acyl-carrier protein] reductase